MDCARFHAVVPDGFCGTHPCCRRCPNSRTDADRADGAYGQMCHRHPYPGQPAHTRTLPSRSSLGENGKHRMWVHLK